MTIISAFTNKVYSFTMLKFIQNLDVRKKLWLITGAVMLVLLTEMIISGMALKDNLLEDRKHKTQELVEVASKTISYYYDQAQQGKLSEEEAKQQASSVIQSMRYGKNGYFWINDYNATVVMHPLKPQIIGKNMSNAQDGDGKRHWLEFTNVAKSQGEGFVEYTFLLKSENLVAPKIAYIKGFKPWQWIVGTGIYLTDVDEIFYQQLKTQLVELVVFLAFILLINHWISRSIAAPVGKLSQIINQVRTEKVLTLRTHFEHRDEIGTMGADLDEMLQDINEFICEIKEVSEQLFSNADQLSEISSSNNQRMNQQHSETKLAASAIIEMTDSAHDVAENADNAASVTSLANEKVTDSNQMLQGTMKTMQSISVQVEDVSALVKKLDDSTDKISHVLSEIRGIADQTNLLALNAAIEAARAGDMGRGFAVVADEVRTLAQRTQSSTSEIDDMINALQGSMSALTKAMDRSVNETKQGFDQVSTVNTALSDIVQSMFNIDNMNLQIATAAKQQSAVSSDISENIKNINSNSTNVLQSAEVMHEATEQTREAATRMQALTNRYQF